MIKRFLGIQSVFKQKKYFTSTLNYINKNQYKDRDDDNHHYAEKLPQGRFRESQTIEKTEIQARILQICRQFPEINIRQLDWNSNFKTVGLDSLNQIALLTSIEHEFNMIFPDNVFENFKNLEQVVEYVGQDVKAF